MSIAIHAHARERMAERGASEAEVVEAVQSGEGFPAKFGRSGFRRNFSSEGIWQGKNYSTKQVEVLAVREDEDWIVITVIVKYF